MAKKKITKKARISVIKKRWYTLKAPKVFDNIPFGETLASDPKLLKGRSIKANLNNFKKGIRRPAMELKFRITDVKGSDCVTDFESLEIMTPFVKRLVKRAKKRIDDSFVVETKDEIKVRLKPLILIKTTIQKGVGSGLRSEANTYFLEKAKEMTFNELVNKVIEGSILKELKGNLKKVYPVANVEIRALVRLRK